jgi:polyhydroxybutyrate depolymerase
MRFLLALFLLFVPAAAVASCPPMGNCVIGSGRYLVYPPANWDGKSPLPTLVFLHGYNQQPEAYNEPTGWFMQFGEKNGILLVIPEGKDKTWSYIGSPMENRDDAGFVRDVLDDVEKRFPVDRTRLWVSGFSQGGSMAWYVACALGDRFAAATPVAGAFWEPLPKNCDKGPVNLFHIHGTADEVVPMKGRPIGERWKQGDVMESLAIETQSNGCKAEPLEALEDFGAMKACRTTLSICGGKPKARAALCLHDGGHRFNADFLEAGWRFVQSLKN